ncbi:helix-turn-helix domain-containing protein [Streptomyces sp. UG1]|uniref:helix-turn-helix domain-containing protein n=1 Tax=Streptomyces sp. UG1 TaxID=3417652 RepID=UPI003CE851EF
MHQVNSKLRNARLRLGLTTTQVAERCTADGAKIDSGQVSRYERGIHAPEPRIRVVLARILGVDAATDFGPGALIDEADEGAA